MDIKTTKTALPHNRSRHPSNTSYE